MNRTGVAVLVRRHRAAVSMLTMALAGAALAESGSGGPVQVKLVRPPEPVKTVVAPGEVVDFAIPVTNTLNEAVDTPVVFTLLDFWLRPTVTVTNHLSLKPREGQKLSLRLAAPERGIFKVAAEYAWNGSPYVRDVASFAAWPVPPKKRNTDTFFRDVISCWEGNGSQLKQAARLNQNWVMGHDMLQATWWSHLQPTNGPFQWKKMEYQVTNAVAHGFSIVGSFHTAPAWASIDPETAKGTTKPGYPLPVVPRLEEWTTYVTETVNHYKDRIRFWQVGNEPHVCLFWMGSIEQFAERCQAAAAAAHKADPGCTVLGSGLALDYGPWLERFAKAGGFGGFDAVSYHAYIDDGTPEALRENMGRTLANLKRLLREYPPHRELPIWNTEGGSWSTTWLRGELAEGKMSWRQPAFKLVKHYAVEQSLGVVCHFYYLQNGGNVAGLSPLDVNHAPNPMLMARIAMQGQLDGKAYRTLYQSGSASGRVWALFYESPHRWRTTAVCWAGEKGEVELTQDWGRRFRGTADLMGKSSGGRPRPVR